MAYTPATVFPINIEIFQWQTKANPNPRLANPVSDTDTTLNFTAPPLDVNGNIQTGDFLGAMKNSDGYVETFYVPPGEMSVDGLTATNVVRGVRLAGLDYTTSGVDLAADFEGDSPVYCNISAILFQMMIAAMTGQIGSGGTEWKIGDGTDSTIRVEAFTNAADKPYFEYDSVTDQWLYSNDGISSTPFGTGAGVTGGDGITVTAGDIDIDLTDTTVFLTSSAGVGSAGKVPRLNGSGVLDSSFLAALSAFITNGTANGTTADKNALVYNGNTRLENSDADALNTSLLFAGIASGASSSGNVQSYYAPGPVVSVTAFTLAQRQNSRLWDGQINSSSNTTTDTISATTDWRAQTFTPAVGEDNVSQVTLNFTKTSSPNGSSTVAIYATSAGLPTGPALATATTILNSAITSGDNTFLFTTPAAVTPSTVYAIVWSSGISAGGSLAWNYQNTDVYAGGQRCTSANSGSSWTAAATNDFRFKIEYRGISGESVYLSNTAGELSLTPGTYNVCIGFALSTTQITLQTPSIGVYGTLSTTLDTTQNNTVLTDIEIGFRPKVLFWTLGINDPLGFASAATSGNLVASGFTAFSGSVQTGAIRNFRLGHNNIQEASSLYAANIFNGIFASSSNGGTDSTLAMSLSQLDGELMRLTRAFVFGSRSGIPTGSLTLNFTFYALK